MTPKNPRSSASLGNGYGQKRSICLCTAGKTFRTTRNLYWPVLMLVKIFSNGKIKEGKTCLAMFGSTDKHLFLRTQEKLLFLSIFTQRRTKHVFKHLHFQDQKILTILSISVCVETAGMQPWTRSTGSATSREGKI